MVRRRHTTAPRSSYPTPRRLVIAVIIVIILVRCKIVMELYLLNRSLPLPLLPGALKDKLQQKTRRIPFCCGRSASAANTPTWQGLQMMKRIYLLLPQERERENTLSSFCTRSNAGFACVSTDISSRTFLNSPFSVPSPYSPPRNG